MMPLCLFVLLQSAVSGAGISGSIIDAGSPFNQPLDFARVELSQDSRSSLVVRTGIDGKFLFPQLVPGRYRLSVKREGFIRKSATVVLAANQRRNDLLFALDAAPSIFGHVRDPHGVGMPNVLVEAVEVVYGPRGDRSLATAQSAFTDDRGEYHLYWIDPGEYYIRASTLPAPAGTTASTPPLSFAPTYFPGSRDPRDAALVRLELGFNLSAFDFKMQPSTPIELRGHVSIEATGEGVGTTITVVPAGAVASIQKFTGMSVSNVPPSLAAGDFVMQGMQPGTYMVSAQYSVSQETLTVRKKITLGTSERSLILQLSAGTTVSGLVEQSGAVANLGSARVALFPVDPDFPFPQYAAIGENGQFAGQRVPPGDYSIQLLNLPDDIYVKSARSGDVDILSKPLRIDWSPPLPITVDLAADGGRIEGTVLDRSNHPFSDAVVVLAPDSSRRNSPEQFRVTRSEDDGRFSLRGIPPGVYKLFTWQNVKPNQYMDPAFLQRFELTGLTVEVTAGNSGTATITFQPGN
jgi:hypothetical protein